MFIPVWQWAEQIQGHDPSWQIGVGGYEGGRHPYRDCPGVEGELATDSSTESLCAVAISGHP
jgi:hypothetical protein